MNGIFVSAWIFQTAVGKHSVALSIVNPATTNRAFVQELTERECTVVLKPLLLSFTCATAARETMTTVGIASTHSKKKCIYVDREVYSCGDTAVPGANIQTQPCNKAIC